MEPTDNLEYFLYKYNISKKDKKLKSYKNIDWIIGSAEKLPVKDNSCDYIFLFYLVFFTGEISKFCTLSCTSYPKSYPQGVMTFPALISAVLEECSP